MKKYGYIALSLALSMSMSVPALADTTSQITKAETVLGIDNSDKKTIERIGLLEDELGISEVAGTVAERMVAIENELGIEESSNEETESEEQSVTDSEGDSVEESDPLIQPSDDFIIERIKYIDTVVDAAPVTEEHDPNGNLNKQGGYIGCVYFADSRVDKSKLYIEKDNVIDIGTEGGGAIEVYRTAKEAEGRYSYLDSLTLSGFGNGSYKVAGTCVIRISDELTASQQTEMTDTIIQLLSETDETKLEDIAAQSVSASSDAGEIVADEVTDEYVLYDQDGYRISCFNFDTENYYYGAVMKMRVQNLTHHDVTFSEDGSYVNGQSMMLGAYFNVASGKTATSDVYIQKTDLKNAGIDQIEDITFNFSVVDSNSFTTLTKIGPLSVSIDADGKIENKVVYRDRETIAEVQALLNARGYDCGSVDGVAGKNTNNQILRYERDHGLKENTDITDELLESLRGN